MTLQLISFNLVVLKDPIPQQNNFLKSRKCKKTDKITGGEWWSTEEQEGRITIKMSDIINENLNMKSDLTES